MRAGCATVTSISGGSPSALMSAHPLLPAMCLPPRSDQPKRHYPHITRFTLAAKATPIRAHGFFLTVQTGGEPFGRRGTAGTARTARHFSWSALLAAGWPVPTTHPAATPGRNYDETNHP